MQETECTMFGDQFNRRWHNELLPPPEGAEMTRIRPDRDADGVAHSMFWICSRIFSNSAFILHDLLRDLRSIGFRADGVDLPVHLLREKIQRAAHRLDRVQVLAKLFQMTVHAASFPR